MKCKNCGNNLEIDNAFCPFCGSVNPVAKKHREDMKKYAKDYDTTKKEVISSTRRINDKAIKITVIALTVAAIAVLIPFMIRTDNLGRSVVRSRAAGDADQYLPQLKEYIKAEDFLAVNKLARSHMLDQYSVYDGEYRGVIRITSEYADLYRQILYCLDRHEAPSEGYYSNIGWNLRSIRHSIRENYEIPADCTEYIEHLEESTILLLNTYLNISEEEYYEMCELSDSKRNLIIEEAIHEIRGEK